MQVLLLDCSCCHLRHKVPACRFALRYVTICVQAKVLPQRPEDTVDDGPHDSIPAKHVKSGQDRTPSELCWEIGPYNAEQHGNNVQHDALQPANAQDWLTDTLIT